ncbi:MAG TPA: sulfur reduction protein DsrE, partial [Dermatophilaceae bacterium]|nr:sulfur reduction protein DsrE [Dermatophilaceae bacterium]
MPSPSRNLIIKLTVGVESPEKLSQAFTVAATGAASGAAVSLWLTGESTWLAVPGRAEAFSLPHAATLSDLRNAVLAE